MLARIADNGLVNGERIGADAEVLGLTRLQANAAVGTIVTETLGETYREMLKRMAAESGIETPSTDDLVPLDRTRKGKKLANADWVAGPIPTPRLPGLRTAPRIWPTSPNTQSISTPALSSRRRPTLRRKRWIAGLCALVGPVLPASNGQALQVVLHAVPHRRGAGPLDRLSSKARGGWHAHPERRSWLGGKGRCSSSVASGEWVSATSAGEPR